MCLSKKCDVENKPRGAAPHAGLTSRERTPEKRRGGEGKLQTCIYTIFLHLIRAGAEESGAKRSRSLPHAPAPITPAHYEPKPHKPALLKQNRVPMVTARIFCISDLLHQERT